MDERARKHFDAIGRAMHDDEGARIDEAMAMGAIARINLGLRLGASMPTSDAIEAELDRRALEQVEIHLRLRRLARSKNRPGR